MSNCPICGSKGDDLVFKFYCSNKSCANFKPSEQKPEELKPNKNGDFFNFVEGAGWEVVPWKGFHCDKKWQRHDEEFRNEYLADWGFLYRGYGGHLIAPRFKIVIENNNDANIVWKDKVPRILDFLLLPDVQKFIHLPFTPKTINNLEEFVHSFLCNLVSCGNLTWNVPLQKWVLYFEE